MDRCSEPANLRQGGVVHNDRASEEVREAGGKTGFFV